MSPNNARSKILRLLQERQYISHKYNLLAQIMICIGVPPSHHKSALPVVNKALLWLEKKGHVVLERGGMNYTSAQLTADGAEA